MIPLSDQILRILIFSIKLLGLITIGTCLFYLTEKAKKRFFEASEKTITIESPLINPNTFKSWSWISIIICMVLAYAMLASASFLSWPTGDEWVLMRRATLPLHERISLAIDSHFSWVARFPEIVGAMGLHRNCWQDWLITPLFVIAAPLAILRLCNRISGERQIMTPSFYIFLLAGALFISPYYYTSYWVNVTYVWTSVPIIYFVSLFWDKPTENASSRKIVAIGALGIYCGWATETTAQLLMILLSIRVAWLFIKKTPPSKLQISAYIGCMIGVYMLLSSPALECRQSNSASFLTSMDKEDILAFVQNLTWEKVQSLGGGLTACYANLKGIPFLWRCYFIPYILLLYLDVAFIPACLFAILAIVAIFTKKWRTLAIAGIMMALSIESALAYLAGAIPHTGSYIPPAIIALCAGGYLLHQLKTAKWLKLTLNTLLMGLTIIIYIPDIFTAAQYKHIDNELDGTIAKLSAQGHTDIILENLKLPPLQAPDHNIPSRRKQFIHGPLKSMIYNNQIKYDHRKTWTNITVTRYFQTMYPIESIRRLEQSKDKH